MKSDIKSLTLDEIEAQFRAWGEPSYRATQLTDWLYKQLASDWQTMTNLPRALRDRLASQYGLYSLELVTVQESRDGTRKFLWRLQDRELIESVLIPANPALYGPGSDRTTICISSQVGCAYRCAFCASGLHGWKRNLAAEEIVEQVLAVERWYRALAVRTSSQVVDNGPAADATVHPGLDRPVGSHAFHVPGRHGRLINNVVLMGMGEPLANYDNVLKAVRILNAPWGLAVGARKITISTAGRTPEIRRLADEELQLRLAVSLHAATDDIRSKLMPINRKYPLADLVNACKYYSDRKGKMITLEYILIDGVNDSPDQARALAALARKIGAKVNLIPYNEVEGLPWKRPPTPIQRAFQRALKAAGVNATLRREKGADIDAACGQLRLKSEQHPNL
ncbi:MAG: 23S rRNA (adenine(2503)-C(2))-methyltransferase RlmN [Verrucomicrobiae bacterium]|nr:23S rRNA (adenine(2503)-C(2))-methyltransferase RlmN [Verrucomicrobiae bacterium]